MTDSTLRTILVTGATGKQGSAFIQSALAANSNFRFLALTRNTSSPAAKSLASDKVQVVQGDLDNSDSVRKVFQDAAQSGGGIWGVFAVLAFPGLGADASGEEKQGMMLADIALEFKVQHFVFSSSERGGEGADDTLKLDRAAKIKIERHIRALEGLPWTILRPAFFMENFDGTIGTITATVLRCGLKPDTKVQLIAAEDIGHIARAVFEAPEQHASQAIVVVGDVLTPAEQAAAYKRGAGRPLPAAPNIAGRALIALNKHTKDLVADMERVHRDRCVMDENYEQLIARCRALYPGMLTFEEWAKTRGIKGERKENWNKVSIMGLIRGKQ